MNGKINLAITEDKIQGVIEISELSIVGKIIILDAIMSGMHISGFERQMICDVLVEKGGPAPKSDVDDLFANLFKQLKES